MVVSIDPRQRRALESVAASGRALSTAMVMFHTNVAESVGLGATDEKVLELIQRFGSLTPGDLVAHTGLAKNSVSDVLDRLTRRGFLERAADPDDRRRVRVTLTDDGLKRMSAPFEGLVTRLDELNRSYTSDQLELVADYLERAADIQMGEARKLEKRV